MMRRVPLIAALLFALPAAAQTENFLAFRSTGTPSSCTNTSVMFWWQLEEATLDAGDYWGSGDNTATLTNMTISSGSPASQIGTNALRSNANNVAQNALLTITNDDIVNDCTGRVGFWFYWDSTNGWPTLGARLWRADIATSNDRIDIRTRATTGAIDITYRNASSLVTFPNSDTGNDKLTANTWHYVQAVWDCSGAGATDTLRLLVDTSIIASSSLQTLPVIANTLTRMYVGNDSPTTGSKWLGPIYIDQVIVTSDINKDLYECRNVTTYP